MEDQYINQTPNAGSPNHPPLLTVRIEGYEAVLRIYEYPRELWAFLTKWAKMLHRYHRGSLKTTATPQQIAHMKSLGVET